MSEDKTELVSEASKYKDGFTGADFEEYNKLTNQLTEAVSKLAIISFPLFF